ncbi:hypothetical protein [Litorihabitans aurantiacus]|uniref:Uncharacterized protein n=1 Tax=Litorihabitans aurantiacus TaxID=1930061 RepID=A0AA37XH82_9MICO|nr:hypothetical protein [Litorihabitans aurantiacus]GMA33519.1 hypothetical protein GCM10025875_35110 [Litorihabitans aurantiacus]GMA33628.1 hypothetical protein GCM10025875_36200 [Litorihabitans aurantiacus]
MSKRATVRASSWSTFCLACGTKYGDDCSSEVEANAIAAEYPYCSGCEEAWLQQQREQREAFR